MNIKRPVLAISAILLLANAANLRAINSSQPLNLKDVSIGENAKSDFLCLGYKFGRDHIHAPDGHALTIKEYEKETEGAFNYKAWIKSYISKQNPPISFDDEETKIRQQILDNQCRLDPETNHVLSAKYKALNNLAGSCLFKKRFGNINDASPMKSSIEDAAMGLEELKTSCAKTPQTCATQTQELNKRLDLYAANDPGFKRLLNSGPSAQSDIISLYQKNLAEFDGETSLHNLLKASRNQYATQIKPSPAYNDQERMLSRRLQRDVIRKLSQNPEGRRVLKQLKVNGKIHLPPIFVLETYNDAAFYDWTPRGDRVVLNADYFFPEGLPHRKKLVSDFRAGNRYLLDHPDATKTFLDQYDSLLAHELTHAAQERRNHGSAMAVAGLIPGRDYIEEEKEAYLTQARYLSYDFLRNPKKTREKPYFNMLVPGFIRNPRHFSNGITDGYLLGITGMPQDNATLKTAGQIAETQKKVDQILSEKALSLTGQNFHNTLEWLRTRLSLKRDEQEISNVHHLEKEYDSTISNLINDSTALRTETAAKIAEFNIVQARKTRNLNQRLIGLSEALQWSAKAKPQVQEALKKEHLSPDQVAKRLIRSAQKLALKNPGKLSKNQHQNLYDLLESAGPLYDLSPHQKNQKDLFKSKFDQIWDCGNSGKNCDQLRKK